MNKLSAPMNILSSSFKKPEPAVSNQIGIANLPNQHNRVVTKRGIDYNILVVGESGLGKTTTINCLLGYPLLRKDDLENRVPAGGLIDKTIEPVVYNEVLVEKGFELRLNIIDTPGFGDQVNNHDCWVPICQMIDQRYKKCFEQESFIGKRKRSDPRIHACLYFLPPSGQNLRQIDVEAMRVLGERVNVIPIIGKADLLTKAELVGYKKRSESDDEQQKTAVASVVSSLPLSIVSSETDIITREGHKVKGRQYPWGYVEDSVENEEYSDMKKLRNLLFRVHMADLIQTTQDVYYDSLRDHIKDGKMEMPISNEANEALDKKYKEEEEALRKKFMEQIKQEESRFKSWEQRLISERDRLNKQLEEEHAAVKKLQEEVSNMMRAAQAAQ